MLIPGNVYANRMNGVRKGVICLLMAVLPLSSWADTTMPCAHDHEQAAIQNAPTDGHAHHSGSHHPNDSDTTHDAAHRHAPQEVDSPTVDCPCCDDCMAVCALSSCSLMAIHGLLGELSFEGFHPSQPQSDAFHVGPTLYSLFRPPIHLI